jgi:hypothetical protein
MTTTMSPLGAADSMMTIAQEETGAAMFVLPPAMWINFQFKLCKGMPANIDKAGQAWRDTAQQLHQLSVDLQRAAAAVPHDDWSADDRTACEQKIKEFCGRLEVMYTFCLAVGIALTVFACALFTYAVFAVAMGTFVGALSAVAAAAMVSVVGEPVYAECLAIAATCLEVTMGATAILAGAATGVAAVFEGGAVLGAVVEHFKGDDAAFGDLGADRDKGHTGNVGGIASVKTADGNMVTAGGHVKYGDEDWQGVKEDGEVRVGVDGGHPKFDSGTINLGPADKTGQPGKVTGEVTADG